MSVVVAAYRTRERAVRAVRSALDQTGVDVEVIAVDDASGDGTADLLRALADPRLRVLEQGTNGGPGAARNRALDVARGTWVAILDSDDWFAPERCARLLDLAAAGGASLVADNLWLVPPGLAAPRGTLFGGRLREPRTFDAAGFVRATLPGRATLALGLAQPLVRRDLIERDRVRYDARIRYTEDFEFSLRCLLAGGRLLVTPAAYYFYSWGHPGAVTGGDRLRNVREALAVNEALLAAPLPPDVRAALRARARVLRDDVVLQSVLAPLRARDPATAFRRAVATPAIVPAGLRRLAAVAARGWGGRRPGPGVGTS